MRLLFVSEATGWTGGANQIWLTAQELKKRGHDILVACNENGELSDRLKAAGIDTRHFRIRQDYDVPSALKLGRMAKDWKADLVHAHHPKAHAMALLAAKLCGVKSIATRRVIKPINRNPFSRYKYASKGISRYVAVCQAAADELHAVGVERERISVIPSGIQMERFEVSREARSVLRDWRPWRVVMVAHWAPIKGHEFLLKAAALNKDKLPNVVYRLVGRQTQELRPLAESLGIADRVEILGERKDVPQQLAQSHLYAMPSLQEGIGGACIEAQAGLLPVVASRVGGLPQVIDDGRTGWLVPPGDPQALADAIAKVFADYAAAERMAQAGYEKVRKEYALEAVVDRLEAFYQECCRS